MIQALTTIARVVISLSALGIVSWAGGVVAYAAALRLFFSEVASSGDWEAILAWSGPLYAVFVLFVIWPVLLRLTVDYGGRRRFTVFPAAAFACGLAPTIAMAALWGGRHILSPEALLFGTLFCTAGALFGAGYAVLMPWIQP